MKALRVLKHKGFLRVSFFSTFAMVAMVACGEGFQIKKLASGAPKPTVVGASATFRPDVAAVKSYAGEYDGYRLHFSIVDPSRGTTTIVTTHNDTNGVYANARLGDAVYHVDSVCFEFSCDRVGLLVYRALNGTVVEQSAFILQGQGVGTLVPVKAQHGTQIDSVQALFYML